jgi:hypothetical protein
MMLYLHVCLLARPTDSKTFTEYRRRPSCESRWAVTSPAMPEPTTATRCCDSAFAIIIWDKDWS